MSSPASHDKPLEMTFGPIGRVYLGRWQMDLRRMSQRKRTKPTRTLMVRLIPYKTHYIRLESCLNPTAEEYYKNDYPDEESSDYDASEGSDGASSSVPCSSLFFWKQLYVHRPRS